MVIFIAGNGWRIKSCSLCSAECRSLSVILPSLEKKKLSSATQGDKWCSAGNSEFPGANDLFFLISPSFKMGMTHLIHVEWRCVIPQQRGWVCACQLYKYVGSKLFLDSQRNLFEDIQLDRSWTSQTYPDSIFGKGAPSLAATHAVGLWSVWNNSQWFRYPSEDTTSVTFTRSWNCPVFHIEKPPRVPAGPHRRKADSFYSLKL